MDERIDNIRLPFRFGPEIRIRSVRRSVRNLVRNNMSRSVVRDFGSKLPGPVTGLRSVSQLLISNYYYPIRSFQLLIFRTRTELVQTFQMNRTHYVSIEMVKTY